MNKNTYIFAQLSMLLIIIFIVFMSFKALESDLEKDCVIKKVHGITCLICNEGNFEQSMSCNWSTYR